MPGMVGVESNAESRGYWGNLTLLGFQSERPKQQAKSVTKLANPTQGTNGQEHNTHNLINRKQARTKTEGPNRLK
jgi:hypothetical protein